MSPEASELTLFIDNDYSLYKQKIAIFNALARKKLRGTYDPKLAPKAFAILANQAGKKYIKEHGAPGDRWNAIFSPIDRRQAAVSFAREFEDWYTTDFEATRKS